MLAYLFPQVQQRTSIHSELETAYSDLDALNTRLMASLEGTTVQLKLLHARIQEDQAAAEEERDRRADVVAELAMLRAAREAEREAAAAEQRGAVEALEQELGDVVRTLQEQLDEVEGRASSCQAGLMAQLQELRAALEEEEAEAASLRALLSEQAAAPSPPGDWRDHEVLVKGVVDASV